MDANNEIKARLGKLLRESRERAGINQAELARRLGRSSATISRWENAENVMRLVDAPRVAREIGLSPRILSELVEAAIVESVTSASVRTGAEPAIAALEVVLNEALEDLVDHEIRLTGLEGRVSAIESQHQAG